MPFLGENSRGQIVLSTCVINQRALLELPVMPSNFFLGKGCFLFRASCNWKLQFYAENLKCRCHQAIGTSYMHLLRSGLLQVRHHQKMLMSTCSLAFIMVFRVWFILFYFFEADVTRRLYGVCLNPFELM